MSNIEPSLTFYWVFLAKLGSLMIDNYVRGRMERDFGFCEFISARRIEKMNK